MPREGQRYVLLILNKSDSLFSWLRPGCLPMWLDDAGTIVDSSLHDSDDAVFYEEWRAEKTALSPIELDGMLSKISVH